jgi:glucose/arabinose dehydrogenase
MWRFSWDLETGFLWAADVGQNAWEEIDIIYSGLNYGWNEMEASHCYPPGSNCNPDEFELPVWEYELYVDGVCSVTGGYVYRGDDIWSLKGKYIYGDWCTGFLWAADVGQNAWEEIDIIYSGLNYGWNEMEASHCYPPGSNCNPDEFELPVWEYELYVDGVCSVTGGYVYRGDDIWSLKGKYIYGDWCTGDIWAADVGQNAWEEIDIIYSGLNYGWNEMEASHCYPPGSNCNPDEFELPVWEYELYVDGVCSVTGGYVYRGDDIFTF